MTQQHVDYYFYFVSLNFYSSFFFFYIDFNSSCLHTSSKAFPTFSEDFAEVSKNISIPASLIQALASAFDTYRLFKLYLTSFLSPNVTRWVYTGKKGANSREPVHANDPNFKKFVVLLWDAYLVISYTITTAWALR